MTSRKADSSLLLASIVAAAVAFRAVSAQTDAAPSEEPAPIECDLQGCLDLAFKTSPLLLAAEARQQSASAALGQVNADRMPFVDLDASVAEITGNQLGVLGGGVSTAGVVLPAVEGTVWRTEVGATAPLWQNGHWFLSESPTQKVAKLTYEQEGWRTKSVRTDVAMSVATAYFDALKAEKAGVIYADYVKLVQSSHDLAKAKFEQNLISKSDLLTAEVKVATAKREAKLVEIAGEKAKRALCSAVGRAGRCEVRVLEPDQPSGPPKSAEEMIALALANDPELKALEYGIQVQRATTEEAHQGRYPTVSLDFAYIASDDFSAPPVAQRWIGALQLTVPLFDFGRTREAIAYSQAKETEQVRTLEATKIQLSQEIHDSYFTLKEIETELALSTKQLEQAKEALRVKQGMFEQSLASISEVNEAQSEVLRLQLIQIRDSYDTAAARFVIDFLAAGG
jgi:outer membrane protein TolC